MEKRNVFNRTSLICSLTFQLSQTDEAFTENGCKYTRTHTHIHTNTHTYTHMLVSNKLWKVKASKEEPVIVKKVLKTKPATQC